MSENQIIIFNKPTSIEVINKEVVDDIISKVRKEALSVVADISTKKGREELKSVAYKVSQTKQQLVKIANSSIEDARSVVKNVTSERVRMERELDSIRDEVKSPVVEMERIEAERVEKIKSAITKIDGFNSATSTMPMIQLENMLSELVLLHKSFDFQEYKTIVTSRFESAYAHLNGMIQAREKYDKEQSELALYRKQKAENEERERVKAQEIEREAREKAIAEQARIKAEENAKEAIAKAEREKNEAVIAERNRVQKVQADEQRRVEKLERNKLHVKKIQSRVFDDLLKLNEEPFEFNPEKVMDAIVNGKIAHIKIDYSSEGQS